MTSKFCAKAVASLFGYRKLELAMPTVVFTLKMEVDSAGFQSDSEWCTILFLLKVRENCFNISIVVIVKTEAPETQVCISSEENTWGVLRNHLRWIKNC